METLNQFIEESLRNRNAPHKQIVIGMVDKDAQQRIKDKCGKIISKIEINRYGIIHTITKENHNLEANDLLHAVEVINTATDISLSPKQHKGCDVLIFKKDIDNEITFLIEVHATNDYLLVFDAWRKKRLRRGSDAVK
jgi:hypothetical protein